MRFHKGIMTYNKINSSYNQTPIKINYNYKLYFHTLLNEVFILHRAKKLDQHFAFKDKL